MIICLTVVVTSAWKMLVRPLKICSHTYQQNWYAISYKDNYEYDLPKQNYVTCLSTSFQISSKPYIWFAN